MSPAIIMLALLFFTSMMMAVAMAIAWIHFGHRRHVASWAVSYLLATCQWVANALGIVLKSPPIIVIATCLIVVSGALVFAGVRQRAGRSPYWGALIVGGLLACLAGGYAAMTGNRPLQGVVAPGFVCILTACSAWSMWPRERRFTAPEMALFVMFCLFTLFQAGLVTSAALELANGPGASMALYRTVMTLCLPSLYVGTGVAAVLVVAGDLAQQLRRQMRHDPLTDALNRRGLEEAAARAIANARRHARPLALVVCDLDGFKALNDGHGHIAGDDALRGFAGLLQSAVRRGDIVARMGGDEFGLLLIDTDAAAAAEVMERVRAEISVFRLPGAPDAQMFASFGVSELTPDDAVLDDLVARADAALYEAKNQGKNRVAIWRKAA